MENNLDKAKEFLLKTNVEFFTEAEQNVIGKTMVAYCNLIIEKKLEESYAIVDVKKERQRQDEKWGEQNHNVVEWIAILTEEVGEAAKDAVDFHFANGDIDPNLKAGKNLQFERLQSYRTEMIQVAAVAISAVESLDRALSN